MKGRGLIYRYILALLITLAAAGVGYGAQTVTITVAPGFTITVDAVATIASTAPPSCTTTSTTVTVKSNKPYNVQIRSEPVTYPSGKAKNGAAPPVEMTNAFQWSNDGTNFNFTTATYVNIFSVNQPKTPGAGTTHTISYKQCMDFVDDPGTYTIVIEHNGVQF